MRREECLQLLAVISPITLVSWWMPWEIGVATEKECFLASFVSGGAAIPDSLQKCPYLQSMPELDKTSMIRRTLASWSNIINSESAGRRHSLYNSFVP
jgi:hypothetical protein